MPNLVMECRVSDAKERPALGSAWVVQRTCVALELCDRAPSRVVFEPIEATLAGLNRV